MLCLYSAEQGPILYRSLRNIKTATHYWLDPFGRCVDDSHGRCPATRLNSATANERHRKTGNEARWLTIIYYSRREAIANPYTHPAWSAQFGVVDLVGHHGRSVTISMLVRCGHDYIE